MISAMHSRLLLLAAAALAGLLGGCGRPGGATAPESHPALTVRLADVRVETAPIATEITGSVVPRRRAVMAARMMGAIEQMPAVLGQRVRRGDLLVQIAAEEIAARVVQARSQLDAARRDFDREHALLAEGASTPDMVKGLRLRLTAAEAMVREAEAMLGYATIRAPFDGVVARKYADAGDLASPGLPLLEIEGTGDFQVEAAVPDSLALRLSPGAVLAVEVPAERAAFQGRLVELSSAADPAAHTVTAKIAVPDGVAVRSGMFARVEIPGPPATAVTAPASAVSTAGEMQRVFIAGPDGRAILRLVTTGARRGDRIEILSGLDGGEKVVVAPPVGLREGRMLEARP